MAEIDSPQSAADWTEDNRPRFSERWKGANFFNFVRPSAGFEEYKTIRQRTYFYQRFDQIGGVRCHEILWPAAARVVTMQMSIVDNPIRYIFITAAVKPLAEDGNKAIFNGSRPASS